MGLTFVSGKADKLKSLCKITLHDHKTCLIVIEMQQGLFVDVLRALTQRA